MNQDLQDWLTLLSVPGLGPAAYLELLRRFDTPGAALRAPRVQLRGRANISDRVARAIAAREGRDWAALQIEAATSEKVRILTFSDPEYPPLLKQIHAPPPVLFVKGDTTLLHRPTLAIVGSRSFTDYGRDNAHRFASQIAMRGMTVVSGLAKGIDTQAHRGALAVGGHTAAVLGSGLDVPYPPQNLKLFEKICERGAVVSEFPMGTGPEAHNFPRRNRIISGLSLGVLIVEAGRRSGALITARHAVEQNREVFAVPGPVDSGRSIGAHQLIRQGAVLAEQVEHILEELGPSLPRPGPGTASPRPSAAPEMVLSDEETNVRDCLTESAPLHVDVIASRAELTVEKTLGILLGLELSDLVEQLPGKRFLRKSTR